MSQVLQLSVVSTNSGTETLNRIPVTDSLESASWVYRLSRVLYVGEIHDKSIVTKWKRRFVIRKSVLFRKC